ncbi:MAG: hypothetical protein ACNI3C_11975 [Candidatus Marinarcus sp.]|uniref:hypothetical protein n=1 Tax=Candidatus Marinarcus sp. TaxID=3100987 RepID=UPI003B00489A
MNQKRNNNLLSESKFLHGTEVMQALITQWKEQLSLIYTKSSGTLVNLEMGVLTESMYKETLESINENIKQLIPTMKYFNDYFNQNNEKKFFNLENCIENSLMLVHSFFERSKIVVHTTFESHIEIFGVETELMQVLINIFNRQIFILTQNKRVLNGQIFISTKISMNQIEISIKNNSEKDIEKIEKSKTLPTTKEILEESFNAELKIQNEKFYINKQRFCGNAFIITLNT